MWNISVDKDKSLLYVSVGVWNPNTRLFILKSESSDKLFDQTRDIRGHFCNLDKLYSE